MDRRRALMAKQADQGTIIDGSTLTWENYWYEGYDGAKSASNYYISNASLIPVDAKKKVTYTTPLVNPDDEPYNVYLLMYDSNQNYLQRRIAVNDGVARVVRLHNDCRYIRLVIGHNSSSGITTSTTEGAVVRATVTNDTSTYAFGTWDDLFAHIDAGTYNSAYVVNDAVFVDLGTDGKYKMRIAALDADTIANSSDTVPVSFVSEKLYNNYKRMNPAKQAGVLGTGGLGGWRDSELRGWMNSTFKGLFPSSVSARIKTVKKYTKIYNESGSSVNNVMTEDDLWIPSYRELIGGTVVESSGPTYSSSFTTKKKYRYTSYTKYWTRTAYNSSGFYVISTVGSANNTNAESTNTGVCFGFCVG